MKRQILMLTIFVIVAVILATWLPCQAQDKLYGCAKTNKGTLRLVSNPSECKKSEYPVTLNGSTLPQNPVPEFGGKICWEYQKKEDETGPINEGPFLLTGYVNYVGEGFYLIQGIVVPFQETVMVMNGSAAINGEYIYVTMAYTSHQPQADDDRNNGLIHMRLDIKDLDGTLWEVLHNYKPSQRSFGHYYSAGDLKKVRCK